MDGRVLLSTEPVHPWNKLLTQRLPMGARAKPGRVGDGALASEQTGMGGLRLAWCRAEGRDKDQAELR